MRKRNPVLAFIVAGTFLSTVPRGDAGSVHEARGFKSGHCFEEIARFRCGTTCDLMVFPDTSGSLSFPVSGRVERSRLALFSKVQFRVDADKKRNVTILRADYLDGKMALEELRKGDFAAHEIPCKSVK